MLTVYLVLLLIFVLIVNLYLFEHLSFGVDVDVRFLDKLYDEEPACPWSSIFT